MKNLNLIFRVLFNKCWPHLWGWPDVDWPLPWDKPDKTYSITYKCTQCGQIDSSIYTKQDIPEEVQ